MVRSMKRSTTTADTEERRTWERYVQAWKAETADEKRSLLAEATRPNCVYTDPLTRTDDHEGLVAYMLDFHRQIPGGHFVTTDFWSHHRMTLAKWEMRGGKGEVLGEGVSYGRLEGDRLVEMTGFFDTPA